MVGITDATGIFTIKRGCHVLVIRRNHHRHGQTGRVVGIEANRIWVLFPGGAVAACGRRSVEVQTRRQMHGRR